MRVNLIKPLGVAVLIACASLGATAQTAGGAQSPAIEFPAAGSGTISGNSSSGVNSNAARPAVDARDRAFMIKAAGSGMYEVEVSKLAEQKAADQGVKDMAAMLVKDHTAANAELMQLAASKGVTLPSAPPRDKQAVIKRMSGRSGAAFDRDYIRTVGISDHQNDIRMFEGGSRSAKDPQLKAFIDKTLPTLRDHLAHAKSLLTAGGGMKGKSAGMGGNTSSSGAMGSSGMTGGAGGRTTP